MFHSSEDMFFLFFYVVDQHFTPSRPG